LKMRGGELGYGRKIDKTRNKETERLPLLC
jgi:hypothetical protein